MDGQPLFATYPRGLLDDQISRSTRPVLLCLNGDGRVVLGMPTGSGLPRGVVLVVTPFSLGSAAESPGVVHVTSSEDVEALIVDLEVTVAVVGVDALEGFDCMDVLEVLIKLQRSRLRRTSVEPRMLLARDLREESDPFVVEALQRFSGQATVRQTYRARPRAAEPSQVEDGKKAVGAGSEPAWDDVIQTALALARGHDTPIHDRDMSAADKIVRYMLRSDCKTARLALLECATNGHGSGLVDLAGRIGRHSGTLENALPEFRAQFADQLEGQPTRGAAAFGVVARRWETWLRSFRRRYNDLE